MQADYGPLLKPGLHPKSIEELRALCVDRFPRSASRAGLMANLEAVVGEVTRAGVHGDFWIDGSFLTVKIEPSDVDLVLHVREGQGFQSHDPEHRRVIGWLNSNLKATHGCDTYVNVIPPVIHMMHGTAIARVAYWEKQFGFSRGNLAKGIAVVSA